MHGTVLGPSMLQISGDGPGIVTSYVEEKFGAPANKSSAVGNPPITKWFYPNFVVVFENDKVLHAVVVAS